MALKNKEINKLFDAVELYFDSWCLPPLSTAFMDCDDAIEGEIAAIKDELTDAKRGRAIFRADADHLRNIVLEKDDELRTANDEIESLKKTIDELKEKLNNEHKHGEDLADINCQLASENVDLKAKTGQLRLLEHSRITWRGRAQHAEKEVEDLNEKISELEKELTQARNSTEPHLRQENDRLCKIIDGLENEINDLKKKIQHLEIENANLRVTPADANAIEVLKRENRVLRCDNKKLAAACEENDRLRKVIDEKEEEINTLKKKIHELEEENAVDAIRVKSLDRANSVLRRDNGILWAKLEERDLDISKRPWHGDGNAMTDTRTCHKSFVETIEELNAKKARLEEKVDLSYGHEFEFGDEVFVPWSCDPYMYIKSGQLYNPRTESLVYVGKDQHLKWFGDKFSIV